MAQVRAHWTAKRIVLPLIAAHRSGARFRMNAACSAPDVPRHMHAIFVSGICGDLRMAMKMDGTDRPTARAGAAGLCDEWATGQVACSVELDLDERQNQG
eukprot:6188778-Pleurochrysis_carterae.AAC.2